MQATPDDASVEFLPSNQIPPLAALYDRFAHALDPFDAKTDEAEKIFEMEIASWYDQLPNPKPTIRDFRRLVIKRIKKYLNAEQQKPPSI